MKNHFLLVTLLFTFFSCTNSPEQKAAKEACKCLNPMVDWVNENESLIDNGDFTDPETIEKLMGIAQVAMGSLSCMEDENNKLKQLNLNEQEADKIMREACPEKFKALEKVEKMGQIFQ